MNRYLTLMLFTAAALCAVSILFCTAPVSQNDFALETPVVVVTFDDADESIYKYAFRRMQEMDSSWTATNFFANNYPGYRRMITFEQAEIMEKAGWESGGHGFVHDNLTAMHPDSALWRIKATYDFLVEHELSHESFAFAWGVYNDTVKNMVAKYYKNIRTSHDFMYLDGIDRLELGYYAVEKSVSGQDIILRIEDAKRMGAPLVIIGFHVILPDTAEQPSYYWCSESAFEAFLKYCKDENHRILSVREAMDLL